VKDISERKKVEMSLETQVSFEKIVMNISTQFINLESDKVDKGINDALQTIGEKMDADRSYI
jgi:hypothetical protein